MSADPWLMTYLARSSAACPVCRRSLTGLNSDRCPSCRSRLALGLAARQIYLAAWGILLAASLGAAGFGLFYDAVIALRPFIFKGVPGSFEWIVCCIIA